MCHRSLSLSLCFYFLLVFVVPCLEASVSCQGIRVVGKDIACAYWVQWRENKGIVWRNLGEMGSLGVGKEKLGTNRSGSCTLRVKTVRAGLDLVESK